MAKLELLDSRLMARVLKVTPRRIQQMARENGLGYRLGGAYIFTVAEMIALADRKKRPGPEPRRTDAERKPGHQNRPFTEICEKYGIVRDR